MRVLFLTLVFLVAGAGGVFAEDGEHEEGCVAFSVSEEDFDLPLLPEEAENPEQMWVSIDCPFPLPEEAARGYALGYAAYLGWPGKTNIVSVLQGDSDLKWIVSMRPGE